MMALRMKQTRQKKSTAKTCVSFSTRQLEVSFFLLLPVSDLGTLVLNVLQSTQAFQNTLHRKTREREPRTLSLAPLLTHKAEASSDAGERCPERDAEDAHDDLVGLRGVIAVHAVVVAVLELVVVEHEHVSAHHEQPEDPQDRAPDLYRYVRVSARTTVVSRIRFYTMDQCF